MPDTAPKPTAATLRACADTIARLEDIDGAHESALCRNLCAGADAMDELAAAKYLLSIVADAPLKLDIRTQELAAARKRVAELEAGLRSLSSDFDASGVRCDEADSYCESPYIAREYLGEGRTFRACAQSLRNLLLANGRCVMNEWNRVSDVLPPDGVVVETKIDDAHSCRNETKLVRQGRLWFFPDMTMYVYYTPTHWR